MPQDISLKRRVEAKPNDSEPTPKKTPTTTVKVVPRLKISLPPYQNKRNKERSDGDKTDQFTALRPQSFPPSKLLPEIYLSSEDKER